VRLFCFPFAGAGASVFRSWAAELPPDIELMAVQLPGRETRIGEVAVGDVDALVTAAADGLAELLRPPFAFYGHSMGALLAFELARRLHAARGVLPEIVLVSGYRAPHLPDESRPVHELPDHELLVEMQSFAGIPDEVLADPELRSLFLPILRADFRVCETYAYRAAPPLLCPIAGFAGSDDEHAPAESMAGWAEHTTANFTLQVLPGDHFFPLQSSRAALLREIGALCSSSRPAPFVEQP
jgi:surfactin synthase thioesterase subunit